MGGFDFTVTDISFFFNKYFIIFVSEQLKDSVRPYLMPSAKYT